MLKKKEEKKKKKFRSVRSRFSRNGKCFAPPSYAIQWMSMEFFEFHGSFRISAEFHGNSWGFIEISVSFLWEELNPHLEYFKFHVKNFSVDSFELSYVQVINPPCGISNRWVKIEHILRQYHRAGSWNLSVIVETDELKSSKHCSMFSLSEQVSSEFSVCLFAFLTPFILHFLP